MKYLFLIVIFCLFSCKSEGEKLDDLQQNELETVLTENLTEIDTTSFMKFFESFIFDKRLQKSNKDNSIDYNFFSSKDFVAYLNSDTLSVFEEKNVSDKQDLIILDLKKSKNLKYKFEKINQKWTFLGSSAISINNLS